MQCAVCQHQNQTDSNSCERCGGGLEVACNACGSAMSRSARFCSECGERLAAEAVERPFVRVDTGPTEPDDDDIGDGELRQITAMFCDLVDYTRLSHDLDPEDLQETLAEYHAACSTAIARYDGHVAQYLGDGVLAYFGYPRAHEDDAERAVQAALDVRSAMAALNRRREDRGVFQMAVRIGINTGPVLVTAVGDSHHQETLAVGETINLAFRIEELAQPGGILVSDSTLRLVRGQFITESMGRPTIKGVSVPIGVHSVDGSAGVGKKFVNTASLTPLTGRGELIGVFLTNWQDVEEGSGRVLMISGEAGIGKSRLLYAFREQLERLPHMNLLMGCSPYSAGSAFQPVIQLYEQGLRFEEDDSPESKLARLESGLERIPGLELEATIPYIAALLGLPESPRFPLEHLGTEVQRQKTIDALIDPIIALQGERPLLVEFEDMHWCDPSTLELVGRLIDRAASHRILIALTFRPEFTLPWPIDTPGITFLDVSRLSKRNIRSVIEATIGSDVGLPDDVMDEIIERSDGVPLFAEELARSVLDSGMFSESDGRLRFIGGVSDLTIPSTIQDSLMARLDRLGNAKRVAQVASILGREFSYSLIQLLANVGEPSLRQALERLVDAQVLYRKGEPPDSRYIFKHALLQETAYESLLKARRRSLHARAAELLEERFAQRVASDPEYMARHCADGGLDERAIHYYQLAGRQAEIRIAAPEAIEYFSRALDILMGTPERDERNRKEIELRLALNGPLAAVKGYADPESVSTCERIDTLCEKIGRGPQQLPALIGLMLHHVNRGHLPLASEYAEAVLQIAEPLGAHGLEVAGHMIRGAASITTATITEACENLRTAIAIAKEARLPPPSAAFDVDALTIAYSTYAIALVTAGLPDSGMQSAQHGLRRAQELGHARTHASALVNAATAAYFLDDIELNRALCEECLRIVDGRGFHSVECSAMVQAGWSRVRRHDPTGIDLIESALDRAARSGALGGLSQLYFIASDAYRILGRLDEAHDAVNEGARIIQKTGEWMGFGPQISAIRGKLLLEAGADDPEEIERLLLDAIAGWNRSGALWLELQSLVVLGRLALSTGRTSLARARLINLYDGFTEGFETDLMREARILISDLA